MPATTAGFKLAVFFIEVKVICNDGMMLLQISKRFYLRYVLINSYFRCMPITDFNKHIGNFLFPNYPLQHVLKPHKLIQWNAQPYFLFVYVLNGLQNSFSWSTLSPLSSKKANIYLWLCRMFSLPRSDAWRTKIWRFRTSTNNLSICCPKEFEQGVGVLFSRQAGGFPIAQGWQGTVWGDPSEFPAGMGMLRPCQSPGKSHVQPAGSPVVCCRLSLQGEDFPHSKGGGIR